MPSASYIRERGPVFNDGTSSRSARPTACTVRRQWRTSGRTRKAAPFTPALRNAPRRCPHEDRVYSPGLMDSERRDLVEYVKSPW